MTEHKAPKNAISNFFQAQQNCCYSFPEKTGHYGNENTDDYHGGNGDIYLQVGPVNDNISRQATDGQLPEPGPEQSDSK